MPSSFYSGNAGVNSYKRFHERYIPLEPLLWIGPASNPILSCGRMKESPQQCVEASLRI
jgi:hypothetical protein